MLLLGRHLFGGSGTGHSEGGTGRAGLTGHPLFALAVITDGNGSTLEGSGETVLRAATPCASASLFSVAVIADAGSDDVVSIGFTVNFASTPPANFFNSGGSVIAFESESLVFGAVEDVEV